MTRSTIDMPGKSLEALIARFERCEAGERIELREDILAFGSSSVGPLADAAIRMPDLSASVSSWLEVLACSMSTPTGRTRHRTWVRASRTEESSMGWRLFRRIRIAPGIRINLSRSWPSLSVGPRGFSKTISGKGVRTTVGLPGTGIFHTDVQPWNPKTSSQRPRCPSCGYAVAKSANFCPHCGAALP